LNYILRELTHIVRELTHIGRELTHIVCQLTYIVWELTHRSWLAYIGERFDSHCQRISHCNLWSLTLSNICDHIAESDGFSCIKTERNVFSHSLLKSLLPVTLFNYFWSFLDCFFQTNFKYRRLFLTWLIFLFFFSLSIHLNSSLFLAPFFFSSSFYFFLFLLSSSTFILYLFLVLVISNLIF
jgi:hypothetical protein